ncbi:MAG: tRNA guanosine(34) transglycosylase Tgt [Chitinivibrionales bacterium]|nr:tRNA guanosine(34) transglycosylase Tgt [Chitinivibrionales bacterium]MBD3395239.1 tRNA guanosine(34) transglycosylase Tgt [Chitinivibrionales bacterium]
MAGPFAYRIEATQNAARAGVLTTPHGDVRTPVFMPVGTQATVKALSPAELQTCGCSIILANTYHLHLRPGEQTVEQAGGLHRFENWPRALLTDSGGYQVFSLRDISKITDDGVTFQSHIDGSAHFFSPESVMDIQHRLGADIIMAFDECPPSTADTSQIARAVDRTIAWAGRCRDAHARAAPLFGYPQALFGIVQGATDQSLRSRCARELSAMDLPGYAVGGLAVGEDIAAMYDTVAYTARLLPREKPRYLMGVGMPRNILECIERGVDMFDCVLPTRNGRNGCAFTWEGKINIRNARHAGDYDNGLSGRCSCYCCANFSRAYLRHLFMAGEILAIRLITLHNVHFFVELAETARARILDSTFDQWKSEVMIRLGARDAGPAEEST